MVAAPVAVGANAEKMYVGVMLQRDSQTQRLYLHDAVAEKEPASQTGGHLITTGPGGSESELYTANILRNALNVKKNNEGSSTRRTLHADVTQSTKSGESNAQPSTNSIRSGNEKTSRAPYGARGLKFRALQEGRSARRKGRAPYGARGLKCQGACAWAGRNSGRAPYGTRGLKFALCRRTLACGQRRAPYGARGLKY